MPYHGRKPDEQRILASVTTRQLFDSDECRRIERKIEEMVREGKQGVYKKQTVDRAPLRTKYFFGEGYTYGGQLKTRGPGNEKLYPKGEVDPIPDWIYNLVIKPIEASGMIPKDWVNSAVVNDYLPGGCIVSHIDPPQLFDRPIITASFLSQSSLSFGCKFSFKPISVSHPLAQVPVSRGCVLSMAGFAADEVTHCIRPEDITERRAVVILRHVPHTAPRMSYKELDEMRRSEEQKNKDWKDKSYERRNFSKRSYTRSPSMERRRQRKNYRARSPYRHADIYKRNHRPRSSRERQRYERSRSRTPKHQRRPGKCSSTKSYSRSLSRELIHSRYMQRYAERRIQRKSGRSRSRSRSSTRSRSWHNRSSSEESRYSRDRSTDRTAATKRKVILSKLPPSIPGLDPKVAKNVVNDDGVQETVFKITNSEGIDHEEEAFQRRLERLKANICSKFSESSDEKDCLKDIQSNSSFEENDETENEERDVKNVPLKDEVTELRKEFVKLKEAIKNLKNESNSQRNEPISSSDSSESEDSKTINAVDIISREVKTTILSKTKSKTKATYLIIKAEKKKNLLKSKLIELRNKKRKMTTTSYTTEIKQTAKKHKLAQSGDISTESDNDIEGNSLMEAIKQRLEKKMRERNKNFGKQKDRNYRRRDNFENKLRAKH